MIETIQDHTTTIAIIVQRDFEAAGVTFLTEPEFPLQLGHMSHPKGHEILPHVHHPIHRETHDTYEVLFVKKGRMRVDFFNFEKVYLTSRELQTGDFVLLVGAGHGITMLEPTLLIEVKNGPYYPEKDKERFENPLNKSQSPETLQGRK